MSDESKKLKLITCPLCEHFPAEGDEQPFQSRDKDEMFDHLQDKHDVKQIEQPKKETISPEDLPLSVEARKYRDSHPPFRLLIKDKKDLLHEVTAPLWTINEPAYKELDVLNRTPEEFMVLYTSYKQHRIKVKVSIKIMEPQAYKTFSIPMGYHQVCMDCPFGFNKTVGNIPKDAKGNINVESINPHEREVLFFKCDTNICRGVII